MDAFPYFLGHADETGDGAGAGANLNFPMPAGTTYDVWRKAMQSGMDRIAEFAPDALVISLGVDTFENDPISFFKLKSRDGGRLRHRGDRRKYRQCIAGF